MKLPPSKHKKKDLPENRNHPQPQPKRSLFFFGVASQAAKPIGDDHPWVHHCGLPENCGLFGPMLQNCLEGQVENNLFFFPSNTWPCLIAAANYRQGTINRLAWRTTWKETNPNLTVVNISQVIRHDTGRCEVFFSQKGCYYC